MLLVVVLVTRYGLGMAAAGIAGEADVEALAMPKKHLTVDGLGSAMGRKKDKDMGGNMNRGLALIVSYSTSLSKILKSENLGTSS